MEKLHSNSAFYICKICDGCVHFVETTSHFVTHKTDGVMSDNYYGLTNAEVAFYITRLKQLTKAYREFVTLVNV
jgi:hypothetical protein